MRTVRRQEIDIVTGRYIQSDPIGFDGGINTYLYANGNSLRFVDEMGLFCAGGVCVDDFFGIPVDTTEQLGSAVVEMPEYTKQEIKKVLNSKEFQYTSEALNVVLLATGTGEVIYALRASKAIYLLSSKGIEIISKQGLQTYMKAKGYIYANPEAVIFAGELIEGLDGYYGGSSPGYNVGSVISGFENFTGMNLVPEALRP